MPAYPIICLEGADGCGKTTLARQLQRKLGAHYVHSTYRFKGRMHLYHWAQLRKCLRLAQTRPVILDRWWPSELVYGSVYRNGPEDRFNWREYHAAATAYGVLYVFCVPGRVDDYVEFYQHNYSRDKEMYPFDVPRVKYTWKLYRDMIIGKYWYFERELITHYDVTIDGYKGTLFANHVVNKYQTWVHSQPPERRAIIRNISDNWRSLGRRPFRETFDVAYLDRPGHEPFGRFGQLGLD